MPRTGKGIINGFRGSIGKTTRYNFKGKSVIKSKNPKRTKPTTPCQEITQSYMRWMNEIYKEMIVKRWRQLYDINYKNENRFNQMLKCMGACFNPGIFSTDNLNFLGTNLKGQQFKITNYEYETMYQFWMSGNPVGNLPGSSPDDKYLKIKFQTNPKGLNIIENGNVFRQGFGTRSTSVIQTKPPSKVAFVLWAMISNNYTKLFSTYISRTSICKFEFT